ncbi:MAG: hypothetical protein JOY96_07210, partial [Verrucomicrobia bacterium]|nr:hypothetical protein [Verrucomicrobiota bacterium]
DHLHHIAQLEQVRLAPEAATAIAVAAEGGLRDAESMLDQLVAFCGDEIGEQEVLEVFGLTSERVVIELVKAVLSKTPSKALELVQLQSEAGKDLSHLLGDILTFMRNILIFKFDPASLKQEISDQARAAISEQNGLVETPMLLRLIEQMSEVESSIKWAANKKLHLEVALIRCVQALSEVSLDKVIDALEKLRNGESQTAPSELPAATAPPRSTKRVEKSSIENLKPVQLSEEDQNAVKESASGTPAQPAMPVEPEVAALPPLHSDPALLQTVKIPAVSIFDQGARHSLENIWRRVLDEVRKKRPLIISWMESATPISLENGLLTVGFPNQLALHADSLSRPNNRKFLEQLLTDLMGEPWRLNFHVREDLVPVPTPPEADFAAEFQKEPLIQKALEIFKAEIQAD